MNKRPDLMDEVYELLSLEDQIIKNPYGTKREVKERFVELAKRAEKENWAEKAMGGEDVLPDIKDFRAKIEKRLAA